MELDEQMRAATPRFIDEAIASRLPEVLPKVQRRDIPSLVRLIHEDMKVAEHESDIVSKLAPYYLGTPEEIEPEIRNIQWSIAGALTGLGTDILEPGAVRQIRWNK